MSEISLDQSDIKNIELNSLADLDRFISEQFNLPLRPYSTDIRAALELVAWNLENSEGPHFEIFRTEEHALPGIPFVASFESEPNVYSYGKTAALAICQAALYRHKKVTFTIEVNSES